MQVNSDKSKVNHRCSAKPDSSHDSETKTLRDDSSTAGESKDQRAARLVWLEAPLSSVDGVEV